MNKFLFWIISIGLVISFLIGYIIYYNSNPLAININNPIVYIISIYFIFIVTVLSILTGWRFGARSLPLALFSGILLILFIGILGENIIPRPHYLLFATAAVLVVINLSWLLIVLGIWALINGYSMLSKKDKRKKIAITNVIVGVLAIILDIILFILLFSGVIVPEF